MFSIPQNNLNILQTVFKSAKTYINKGYQKILKHICIFTRSFNDKHNYFMKLKNIGLLLLFYCVLTVHLSSNAQQNYAIVIHGGAGLLTKKSCRTNLSRNTKKSWRMLLNKGESMLQNGESSSRVVVEVIKLLEDSPLFNAERGCFYYNVYK